jgi:ribosome-binding protein aMBF1 (putative translation factor)
MPSTIFDSATQPSVHEPTGTLRTFQNVADYGEEITSLLATKFASLRAQRGWSLAEVASRADLHRSTIHLIEQGGRGVTVASAARLARALGVRLSEMLAEAEARVGQP